MSFRFICLFFALLGSGSQAFALTEDEAVTKLSEVFRPNVFRLERELVTFHYARTDPKFQPSTLEDVQWRILGRTERFFDVKVAEMMVGAGTYVAVDASSTRDYGGEEDPQLFVIPLRAGGVVLNAGSELSESDMKVVNAGNETFSCASKTETMHVGTTLDTLIGTLRNHENEVCRRVMISTFRQLDVQAILYSYTGSGTLRDCRSNRSEALNVISKRIIDERRMSYYSDKKAIEGAPIAGQILRLYNEGIADFSLRINSDMDSDRLPPKALIGSGYPYPFYRAWKKKKLYKCGPPQALEKPDVLDIFQDKARETFFDAESASLMVDLRRAARTRQGPSSFDITRFRKIELLAYRLSGLAGDDSKLEQWRQAVDLVAKESFNQEGREQQIADLLEEPKSISLSDLAPRARVVAAKMPVSVGPQPGFIWQLITRAGLQPRRAQILENQMLVAFGGFPFVVDRFATDAGKPEAELLQKNRDAFRAVLRECLRIYRDSSRTNQEIASGDCGQRPLEP